MEKMNSEILTKWYISHRTSRLDDILTIVKSSNGFTLYANRLAGFWVLEVKDCTNKTLLNYIKDDEHYTTYNITGDEARCIIIANDPSYSNALTCTCYFHITYIPTIIQENIKQDNIPINDQYITETKIGILAHSIRGNWNDIHSRLYDIKCLCGKIGRHDWIKEIVDNEEDIYDGRWFRDEWSGPYCPVPYDRLELYKEVRDVVEDICDYGCSSIGEYDMRVGYRSPDVLRYGLLTSKVINNKASESDIQDLIELHHNIHEYRSRDSTIQDIMRQCKFFINEEELTEEDKKTLTY